MKRYVLDSFAMIAFLEDEPGADKVESILRALMQNKARVYMSVINWGEIFYNIFREQGQKEAEDVMARIREYPFKIVDADQKLTYEAAYLKGTHKIAYADCFAAALSRTLGAPVVTGDPEFKKLEDKIAVEWL